MDSIELEFETKFGQQKRRKRYDEHNAARRIQRLQRQQLMYPDLLPITQGKQIIFAQATAVNIDDHDDVFLVIIMNMMTTIIAI